VRYHTVKASDAQGAATFTGVTQSGQEAKLAFKVGGVVQQVAVQDGQRVRRGQLIAAIDGEDYALQVEQAEVQVKQAETSFNVARSTYQRVERLYESNSVSLSEFEQAKGNFEATQAQLNAAQKQVQAAENQLSYTRLTAPFDGVISALGVEAGELIGAGNPVGSLSAEGQPEVEVGVADRYVGQLQPGTPVEIRLSAMPDQVFRGEVIEVSYGQSQATTYPVRARFAEPAAAIRPGLSAEVRFLLGQSEGVKLLVPAKAVGENAQGRRFVYRLIGQGDTLTVQQQFVALGDLQAGGFVLDSGLQAGDRIATAGLSSLMENMQVRLLGE
jgi:RND family efflux transporter MFP subunit